MHSPAAPMSKSVLSLIFSIHFRKSSCNLSDISCLPQRGCKIRRSRQSEMTQGASSVHSTVSSLSSSSAISLQQIHPISRPNSPSSFCAQPSTNLATGHSSSNPANVSPPPNPLINATQMPNPTAQANPSQQTALGNSGYHERA